VEVADVTLNPGRTGFLEIAQAMGAQVWREATRLVHGDPVGRVGLQGGGLRGVSVAGATALRALDELPLVAVLAAAAEGETVVAGAGELRVKESDRIAACVRMVRSLGGEAEERSDGFAVAGGGLRGGIVDAGGDHRIAMAAAVAAVACTGEVEVQGFDSVAASWPGFAEALEDVWSSR
jgi:3-phosphoshikimate 1-carboxyvinyltransferase